MDSKKVNLRLNDDEEYRQVANYLRQVCGRTRSVQTKLNTAMNMLSKTRSQPLYLNVLVEVIKDARSILKKRRALALDSILLPILPRDSVTYIVDFSAIIKLKLPKRFLQSTLRREKDDFSRKHTDL